MTIDLTPDLEIALAEAARRQGTTPELLAEAYLRERLDHECDAGTAGEGETLADFLAGYIGVLAIGDDVEGGDRLSEDTGRRFADALSRRRAEGRM